MLPRSFAFLPVSLILACCAAPREGSETSPVGPAALPVPVMEEALRGQVDFARHVRPILEVQCLPCHNPKAMPGQMNLLDRADTLLPGKLGPRIVPGKPEESLLIRNLSLTHAPVMSMPPVGNRLTPDEERILKRWIAQGAAWPADSSGQLRLRD